MNTRNFGQRQFARLRASRAARASVFALVSILLLVTGAVVPVPATAVGCSWSGPYICTDSLPNGTMGASYSYQVTYLCPQAYCEVEWDDNPWLGKLVLPPGLNFALSGLVSGGPLPTPGTFGVRAILVGHDHPAGYVLETKIFSIIVEGTNQQPTFTAGGDLTLLEDDPPYSAIWATDISKGGVEDAGQTLAFRVSNNNNALFSVQPAIAADGTLSFTLTPDANGVATVSVYLEDNGGVANGGINHSPTVTFQINVTPVDSVQTGPIFTPNTTDWATDHACTEENCTLREAIEAANNYGGNNPSGPASTIELAPGEVYAIDGVDNTSADNSPNGLPQITSKITINGHGAHIARSGGTPAARLIDVGGGFLTLNEVALEYGLAGPGIYSSTVGGAILDRGQLVIKNSYFAHNYAEHGGAIYNPGGPAAWIYNTTFYGNEADDGAIHTSGSLRPVQQHLLRERRHNRVGHIARLDLEHQVQLLQQPVRLV